MRCSCHLAQRALPPRTLARTSPRLPSPHAASSGHPCPAATTYPSPGDHSQTAHAQTSCRACHFEGYTWCVRLDQQAVTRRSVNHSPFVRMGRHLGGSQAALAAVEAPAMSLCTDRPRGNFNWRCLHVHHCSHSKQILAPYRQCDPGSNWAHV